jgi:hypothetical protein
VGQAVCQCFLHRYDTGVGKIKHSSSEVVLQTTKHTMIYVGSGPYLEVIVLHPVV